MSNDNISHGNDGEKHSKPTRFVTMHVNFIESHRYQKRLTPPIHEVVFDQNHAIEDDGERAMLNDNNYISHGNDHDKHSKPTRFKTMHATLIEIHRYQKRLTPPIHEVGFDENHGIEDDGERAMSNDNNYISHENDHDKHSKPTRFETMHVNIIDIKSLSKEIDAFDSRSRF